MLQMPCFKFCWHLKHHPYEQHWKQTSTQPTCLNRCLPTARALCRSRAQQSNKHDCNLHNTGNGFNRAIQTSASVLSRTVYVDQNLEAEHSRNLTKQIQWNMTARTTITTQKHQSTEARFHYPSVQHFVRDFLQFWHFRHVIKQVGMSQSAMPATENNMTTCLETFEKDTFCSFPHRHADATGKPETRDETRGRKKTSISCETSSNFDIFDTLSNRHAKQHDNLLGNLRKVHILQLSP